MSVQAAAREPKRQAGLGSLVRIAHHKGRRREMEDLVGFGGGEKGEGEKEETEEEEEGPRGGGERDPAQSSEWFPVAGL